MAQIASLKRITVDSLKSFGATVDDRNGHPVVRVPIYNEHGDAHSYFDLGIATERLRKGMFATGKGSSGLFFPGRLPAAGEQWVLCEGPKDAAAYIQLGYLACGLNTDCMATKYARLFRDVNIIVMPDRTVDAEAKAQKTAARLHGVAASVRIGTLPLEIGGDRGDDARDVLRLADGETMLRQAIDDATEWQPPEQTEQSFGKVNIPLLLDEATVADEVLQALGYIGWRDSDNPSHRVFQRGGRLVHIVRSPASELRGVDLPEGILRIRSLPRSAIRERMTAAAIFFVEDGDDIACKRPPEWLSRAIHERGEYPPTIRPLTAITRCPTLRPDGTVLQEPGYDKATGIYYEPDGDYPPIPESPTRADATKAAEMLLDVVGDFPFAGPEHRSVWLALVLEMIGRSAIAGPTPLKAIDANTPGTGKSLSSDAAGIIAYGTTMPRKAWPRDDDEVRKTITSIAIEAVPAVLWDNVAGTLGCASLDAALTGTTWQDRKLGSNETTGTLPLTTIWVATGNNLVLGADTARRTLYSRLESSEENPEDRQDFQHADLLGWVRDNRHRLAAAAVTILRAYIAAGRPDQHIVPWGSFEGWSQVVRAPIVWLGLPDPCGTRAAVRDSDRSAEVLRLLIDGIEEADMGDGVTAADIIRLLSHPVSEDSQDPYPTLRTAVAEACDKPTARKIGCQLRKFAGRVCAGKRLSKRVGHGGAKVWFVESVGEYGQYGDYVSAPLREKPKDKKVYERETHSPNSPYSPDADTCENGNPHTWLDTAESDGRTRRYCTVCHRFGGFVRADGAVVETIDELEEA